MVRTTALIAGLLMLSVQSANAGSIKLPPQFIGDWCLSDPGKENTSPTVYRFGRCRSTNPAEDQLAVSSDGFTTAQEARCKVLKIAVSKHSEYRVKFQCKHAVTGETWTVNQWMALQLIMQETDREP
jgi:hypothetical protein